MKKEIESELEKIDYNELVEYLTKRQKEEEKKRLQKIEPILKISNNGLNDLIREINKHIVKPIKNKQFPDYINEMKLQ